MFCKGGQRPGDFRFASVRSNQIQKKHLEIFLALQTGTSGYFKVFLSTFEYFWVLLTTGRNAEYSLYYRLKIDLAH